MKRTLVLAAILTGTIVAGASAVAVLRTREEAPPADLTTRRTQERLENMEKRLGALESRLAAIPDLKTEVDRLRAVATAPVTAAAADASLTPKAAEVGQAALAETGKDPRAPAGKLEMWLASQGMKEDFERCVAKVYAVARTARRDREREEANRLQREAEELSRGPYGKFNYRINSLAKKLSLDGRQQEYLHELLTRHAERSQETRGQHHPPGSNLSEEELQRHVEELQAIERQLAHEFQNAFLTGLSAEQREAYMDLPEHERGPGNSREARVMAFDAGGALFVGTGGAAEVKVEAAGRVPLIERIIVNEPEPEAGAGK